MKEAKTEASGGLDEAQQAGRVVNSELVPSILRVSRERVFYGCHAKGIV